MDILTWKVIGKDGNTIAVNRGEEEVFLVVSHVYEEGDHIVFETSKKDAFYMIQVDDALGEELVYITANNILYHIPFGEKKICYSPKTFSGSKHLLAARVARPEEISTYRNLARNVMDQHGNTNCYPHASANVETRGEAVFAAHNAIDGIKANSSHGEWPYGSWGINRREDATWKLEFGRNVVVDKIIIYERADFPHDNWWKQVTLRFSDGTTMNCPMKKTEKGQVITFEKKEISWVQLENLIKADDPSPFPALSQFEIYGTEA